MTLRQVAGGARRSLLGTAVGVTLGIGALFIALPRVMSYLVAGGSLLLAGLALWVFFRRRGAGEA
jgi:hypothetical protein